jgi:hypothetical protein
MNSANRMHWIRAVIGGFLAEAAVRRSHPCSHDRRPTCLAVRRTGRFSSDVFLARNLGGPAPRIGFRLAWNPGRPCSHSHLRRLDPCPTRTSRVSPGSRTEDIGRRLRGPRGSPPPCLGTGDTRASSVILKRLSHGIPRAGYRTESNDHSRSKPRIARRSQLLKLCSKSSAVADSNLI